MKDGNKVDLGAMNSEQAINKKDQYVEFAEAMIKGLSNIHDTMIAELDKFKARGRTVYIESPPQKIQGYTAEQWQEIIDGGYLCEFANNSKFDHNCLNDGYTAHYGFLDEIADEYHKFHDINKNYRVFCRPAQIKRVMRPIFVSPESRESVCHFLRDGEVIESGQWPLASIEAIKYGATEYIEV